MQRREFIKMALGGVSLIALGQVLKAKNVMADDERITKVTKSDDEWKKELDPKAYQVLRHEGTERPFTSLLLNEHREGKFACAGCGLELFTSDTKFDSGTGWPSFFKAIPGHIETKTDNSAFMQRTEYHCAKCGGHQGHVFEDGPAPTGLRYCNNGVSIKFVPKG